MIDQDSLESRMQGKLARPVWGWGPGAIPGPTPLFVGNPQAGETAAKLFTLTKTCTRHRIDPYAYLQDVYARLPTLSSNELPALLPDNWIKEHPQHIVQERVQEALDRARRTRERRAARRAAA